MGFSVALHLFIVIGLWVLYTPLGVDLHWNWVPSLGASFSIRLDGLSMLFSWLICGIGLFVQLYAFHYMKGKPLSGLFHVYLTLFMVAMLGLVLAGNLMLLFVFWELTTVTSYLLIGFNHDQEISRKNALQAMLVTGAGGLALLAGLILLGQMAGTWEIIQIINRGAAFTSDKRFTPALILILIGAFTKSAQVPFHFWLPGAMSAPAPVSAFLHSATMVKAGVYLLARLAPVFSQSDLWFWSLALTGGATAVWTVILTLQQRDLKLMLAYSTNVALGKLVFLLALGTRYAISAALMFTIAHALYKAALFMVIGTVDKATGTRNIDQVAGLGRTLKFSFLAAGLSALSKAGVPPLPGFLSKEYMYKAALQISYVPTILLVFVNALMGAMVLLVVVRPFISKPDAMTVPASSVEKYVFLWIPPLCLGILALLATTIGLHWLNTTLIIPAARAVAPNVWHESLKLWQGLNLPLVLSGASLLFAFFLFKCHTRIKRFIDRTTRMLPAGSQCYDLIVKGIIRSGSVLTSVLQHGRLTGYIFMLFFLMALIFLFNTPALPMPDTVNWQGIRFYEVMLALGLAAAVTTVILSRSRLLAIVSLSVAGFITTLFLMFYNAPDVAKTQLLVETLSVIFLVIIVDRLPKFSEVRPHKFGTQMLNTAIAVTIGAGVFKILYAMNTAHPDTTLIGFFSANSMIAAHGRNIVNVILVDFRAIDTLGEITVVVMAALGASAILLQKKRKNR